MTSSSGSTKMEKRRLGKTGHNSTIAILGAVAFGQVSQEETDRAVETILQFGVNHIDVAPSYGEAELRLGPWMEKERERFFLGCKTMRRTREGALRELRESLTRLRTDYFDLYQIHAVTTEEELNQALGPGGAVEALLEAREKGLTRFLGITGHGGQAPSLFIQALERFDFDTVLFPINYIQYTDPEYRRLAELLLKTCRERDIGTMIIKSIARGAWGDRKQRYDTWYQPFDQLEKIQPAVNFALSRDISGVCTAGDIHLLPMMLKACEQYRKLSQEEQEKLIESGRKYSPLFR
jgi:aryl-alcohol dehydrogenase-like predicted oxidoreductase